LACALRHPDGSPISHSADEACPAAIIENILADFDKLAAAARESTTPQWRPWGF